jgi:plasmid stabilization system protein ParE
MPRGIPSWPTHHFLYDCRLIYEKAWAAFSQLSQRFAIANYRQSDSRICGQKRMEAEGDLRSRARSGTRGFCVSSSYPGLDWLDSWGTDHEGEAPPMPDIHPKSPWSLFYYRRRKMIWIKSGQYLQQESPAAARSVAARIKKSLLLLTEQPHIGHQTDDDEVLEWHVPGLPYTLCKNHSTTIVERVGNSKPNLMLLINRLAGPCH